MMSERISIGSLRINMPNILYEDPEYGTLQELIRKGSCVAFLGSGLSTTKGLYPGWEKVVSSLCQACGLDEPTPEQEQNVDFMLDLADRACDRDEAAYCRTLAEIFGKPVVETRRAYDLLMRLKFKSYITTNFDPLLAMESQKPEHSCRGVYAPPALPAHEINNRAIYYIHGRIEVGVTPQKDQVVLGQRNFEHAYSDTGGTLKSFLHQVFTFQELLFIGCGLREPQLMEVFRICREVRNEIKRERPGYRVPQRYVLLPITLKREIDKTTRRDISTEEDEVLRFQELDIKVIRYDPIDVNHSAIEEFLENWCNLPPITTRSGSEEVV
jgi:hypothetical protein